jgi:histidinol phosphatase-like enzyme
MAAPNESAAAVFLDRDGTLMREVNYCADPKQVEIFSGFSPAFRKRSLG